MPSYETGDFRKQTLALDYSLTALEENLLSFTLWNYTPENNNIRGDKWNDEDLSIFSNDQVALLSVCPSRSFNWRSLPLSVPLSRSGVPSGVSLTTSLIHGTRKRSGCHVPVH